MSRCFLLLVLLLSLVSWAPAQQDSQPPRPKAPPANQPPPRSDRNQEAGESSSKDTKIDLSPPKDDAKAHPNSSIPDDEDAGDVSEFHPWDPHKALKDVEVGDFYFKKKNYRAALERYKEALYYKDNDAVATFRLAQCQEKLGQPQEALRNYEAYLKILPYGPFAEEAGKAITRLKPQPGESNRAEKK